GVSELPRIPRPLMAFTLWALVGLLGLLYLRADEAPYWAHVLRSVFRMNAAAFYPYYLSAFVAVLVLIGPAVVLSGAALPLIFHQQRRQLEDLGDLAGRIYSWNTVGSLLGALLGGYALLFWLDLDQIFRLAMATVVVAAGLVSFRTLIPRPGRRTRWTRSARPAFWGIAVPIAALSGIATVFPAWSPEYLSSGLFRHHAALDHTFDGPSVFFRKSGRSKLLFYDDGPTASIAVKQLKLKDGRVHRAIVTNGKSDSAVYIDYVTTGMLALLPAIFAEKAENAFVIGYGTGVTAGELASLASMREVVVAEISPEVIDAAPLFDYANRGASKHEKVRIVRGDAYRTLLRMDGPFDIISAEPSNPWVAGIEMLYSREFLEAARDRLSPGGVHVQWFHVYETDDPTIAMVLRTYTDVFEHVSVWYGKGNDLLLLGFRESDHALDLDRLERRVRRPDIADGLRRCGIDNFAELLAHELLPLGVLHAAALSGEVHTLLHPRLSHRAARAFFVGHGGNIPTTAGLDPSRRGARNSIAGRYRESRGGTLPDDSRTALIREACEYRPAACAALLAHWTDEAPTSRARERLQQEIRAQPQISAAASPALVNSLARLYGETSAPAEDEDGLEAATRASRLFVQYYHHAAPFSRQVLVDLWRRCGEDPKQRERCDKGRARAEKGLGALATNTPEAGA
ncbi:MAG: fused MFS/spermidine synthase, partial [Myxococcota bacterium]